MTPGDDPANQPEPLAYLESLASSDHAFLQWLRNVIFVRRPAPVVVPQGSDLAASLIRIFNRGSEGLRVAVRRLVPVLLSEWRVDSDTRIASDLLYLVGTLGCAEAEPAIVRLIGERLTGHPDEVELRRTCLMALGGLGCNLRTRPVFEAWLPDPEYAYACFLALAGAHPGEDAAGYLLRLMDTYAAPEWRRDLLNTLRNWLERRQSPGEREVIGQAIGRRFAPDKKDLLIELLDGLGFGLLAETIEEEASRYFSETLKKQGEDIDSMITKIQLAVVAAAADEAKRPDDVGNN